MSWLTNYLRNRATPTWHLPADFVWGVQAEWRRTGGTWCRDLGRQATGPEDPVDHGRLVDQRDQTQAAAIAATRHDVKSERPCHQRRPALTAGSAVEEAPACRRELSADWPLVLARLLGGFAGAPDASICR
jgi:hypothetical protein